MAAFCFMHDAYREHRSRYASLHAQIGQIQASKVAWQACRANKHYWFFCESKSCLIARQADLATLPTRTRSSYARGAYTARRVLGMLE